ncbi:hypothetical protein COEREDRAFT_9513 [Coemansia reversa NRRL 1564]|uniref:Uncharacterized protein n=1 Tax=Coemansia reversa (strain ATCC 12441 / NRRL 1564) TaxID=763665 RepID=A0A2G5B8M8_COERN|nr:hypothetical protein COEREDRAFT_9513 [Coemansia reversa NRRL 1564]|eukprot:PIA15376.1 hypothetical protein COEREDRAFT_9513 [Coemansia reversa NRRL 1564]
MKLSLYLLLSAFAANMLFAVATSKDSGPITLEMLNVINPAAARSTFCKDFEKKQGVKGECILNSDAVAPINKAIAKYKITRLGEIAATLAWMLFESEGWHYVINHNPGNKGQGTRTMMSWAYVSKYAKELYPDKYAKVIGKFSDDTSKADNSTKTKVMDLVLNNDDSLAAGFWYLTKQASSFHNKKDKLRTLNLKDFKDYTWNGIKADVSTDDNGKKQFTWEEGRTAKWNEVNKIIGKAKLKQLVTGSMLSKRRRNH